MIYKLLLLTAFSAASLNLHAQVPTLTNANVSPSLNDSFLIVAADTTGITPGASGAGITWNFSGLVTQAISDSVSIGNVIYASTAPSYSGLALAASLIPSTTFSTSTHATVSPSSTFTTYYIASASKLSTSAIYYSTTANSLYTDPMDVFRFPFTFGSSFTDAYAGYATYGSLTATQTGNISVNADAWGTLILPPAPPSLTPRTYTGVLRVHGYQIFKDSLGVFPGGIIYDTLETYTWYQPGYHTALLTISTMNNTIVSYKTVSYARRQIADHQAVGKTGEFGEGLNIYPNPANSVINIVFDALHAGNNIKVSLTDIWGREVAVIANRPLSGAVNISYDMSDLPKGLYFVKLQSPDKILTKIIDLQ